MQAKGTRKSQMRSVSAFVNPASAADPDDGGKRDRRHARAARRRASAEAAIGGPSTTPHATAEPNAQYA